MFVIYFHTFFDMYLLYSLTLTLAFLALLPYFAYQAVFKRKYLGNFGQRFGRLPRALRENSRATIWLHAVSVGETLAAVPLVEAIRTRFPEYRIIISTTTATGQTVATSRLTHAAGFCYFPFDFRFAVRRALNVISPQIVVLMESELWPNFLRTCEQRKIPVVVANGRISDRSFRRSQRFRGLLRMLYEKVAHFAVQTPEDARRSLLLGAPPERVTVCGNLKYDVEPLPTVGSNDRASLDLAERLNLSRGPLIIAGSTTEGEEPLIIAAFGRLRKMSNLGQTRLLIAPRHPERFDSVARLLESNRLRTIRRSNLTSSSTEERGAETILLDSMGELAGLFQFASAVLVGGSLVPRGGHNILEPARSGRPIIVGPYMENFREMASDFLDRRALIQLKSGSEEELIAQLSDQLARLLSDSAYAAGLSAGASSAAEARRGAAQCIIAVIERAMVSKLDS